ncbi:MAG TPA: hypothetical protein VMS81_02385 [Methanomicrobiales archaeon]|jgi:hypothetical protein|nr:hypothetical protein [Methanomicrobiales archaeon]
MAGKGKRQGGGSRERNRRAGEGGSLVERYRKILVDRLTPGDLEDLQFYLRNQFDKGGNLNREWKDKFEWKLRQFLHEEILTREIIGIEALIRELTPEDLRK